MKKNRSAEETAEAAAQQVANVSLESGKVAIQEGVGALKKIPINIYVFSPRIQFQ